MMSVNAMQKLKTVLNDETSLCAAISKITTKNKEVAGNFKSFKFPANEMKFDKCKNQAAQIGFAPNFNQFACAAYVHHTIRAKENHNKMLIIMPPGKGKSRVALSLMYLFANGTTNICFDRVVMVFTHHALLTADEAMFTNLAQLWSINIKLASLEDVKNGALIKPKDFVIYDEADFIFLDEVFNPPPCKFLVGLTATPTNVPAE